MSDIRRTTISLDELLPKTRRGIERFCHDHGSPLIDPACDDREPLVLWAELWFHMRAAEDRPEWFPSGKWATLQRIETMIHEAAKP